MVEYVSQVMRQASYKATMLLDLFGIDPFSEDLAKDTDRVSTLKEGQGITSRLIAKTWQKMKNQGPRGVLLIWSHQ